MKKTIAVTMALTMTAAALAGCSSSSSAPATTAAPKTEAGSEASGDTQAAGSEEKKGGGKLVVYSPNSEGLMNATIPLFEEKYGVDVEVIQAGTGELVKRIQSEKMIRMPTYSSAVPGLWPLTMKTSGNHTYLPTTPVCWMPIRTPAVSSPATYWTAAA